MANDVVPAGSDTPTDAEQALPPPPQRRPSSDAQSSSPKATTATTKPPSPSSSSTAHPRNPLLEEDDDDDPFSKDVEGGVAHSVHHHDDDDDELIRSQQQQRDEHYEQASQGVVMPYYYLLRDSPAYRLMWFASIVSMLGDWLNFLATLSTLKSISSSANLLSLFLITRMLPYFVLTPVVGALADRFDRRKLMLLSDVARMFTVLLFIFVRSSDSLWLLYVASILQFSFGAVFDPARSALIPNLLPSKKLLTTAGTLASTTWSCVAFFGAALGGGINTSLGTTWAYIIDALTYLVSASFVLLLMRHSLFDHEHHQGSVVDTSEGHLATPTHLDSHADPASQSLLSDESTHEYEMEDIPQQQQQQQQPSKIAVSVINETSGDNVAVTADTASAPGAAVTSDDDDDDPFQSDSSPTSQQAAGTQPRFGALYFLWLNPYVLFCALIKASSHLTIAALNELNITFAEEVFPIGENGSISVGLLYTVIGLGTAIIPLMAKAYAKNDTPRIHETLVVGFSIVAIFAYVLAWSPNIYIFLACTLFRSGGSSICWTFSTVLLQDSVPDQYRGRTFAIDFGFSTLSQMFSVLVTGLVLDELGLSINLTVLILAVIATMSAVFWGLYFLVVLRRYYPNYREVTLP